MLSCLTADEQALFVELNGRIQAHYVCSANSTDDELVLTEPRFSSAAPTQMTRSLNECSACSLNAPACGVSVTLHPRLPL